MRLLLLALILTAVPVGVVGVQPAGAAVVIKGVSTASGYATEFVWQPNVERVASGTKVVWRAVSGTHTVTAWKGAWSKGTTIDQGSRTSFTFKRTGVFKFRCEFHSTLVDGVCTGMCGKIVVR